MLLPRLAGAPGRAAWRGGRRRRLSACRFQARASARASGVWIGRDRRTANALRPVAADHAGVLQDAGDSPGGGTRLLRVGRCGRRRPPRLSASGREAVLPERGSARPASRRINIDHASGKSDLAWMIVGVVSDVKSSLDGPFRQTVYVPSHAAPDRRHDVSFRARELDDPMRLANSATAILRRWTGGAIRVGTLDDVVGGTIARQRALSILVVAFAASRTRPGRHRGLRCDGVLGPRADTGDRRPHGARRHHRVRVPPRHWSSSSARRRSASRGPGRGGLLTRLIERLLFGIEPLDPWTFTATALVLLAVAAIASYVPARRGTQGRAHRRVADEIAVFLASGSAAHHALRLRRRDNCREILGGPPLAERRVVPAVRQHVGLLRQGAQRLGVQDPSPEAEVHAQDRDDFRGLAARPGQVAAGRVDDCELQERRVSRTNCRARSA